MIKQNPSRNLARHPRASYSSILILLAGWLATVVTQAADKTATKTPAAIPWNEIGAKVGADYTGDGLAVTPAEFGARLHCAFQRLDGEATPEGLWLTSTVTNTVSDRFRVRAMEVGRTARIATFDFQNPESSILLPDAGEVSVRGQTVRLSRPGLTEEYSVSMDGVRQDFIVEQAPLSPANGELLVKLAVSGAQVEPAADGARMALDHSGRKIAYSRLRVTDATGKELSAWIEVASGSDHIASLSSWLGAEDNTAELAVVVDDADAVYPVRIDPTFSDANWVSMGGFPGANNLVSAALVDDTGNLYIGGQFTIVDSVFANGIAEWNGSSWSALGSGVSGGAFSTAVSALAVSGGTLYAGGFFTNAGGNEASNIAQWNGSTWTSLGSGVDGEVRALAVAGGTLYVGGNFTTAGSDTNANNIAQWNGNSWSGLGSGMNGEVDALAMSGSTLYACGSFTNAGGNEANEIAQWNGSSWSALGSGISGGDEYSPFLEAVAVAGGNLYVGGFFTNAGGISASNIAEWNGSTWSALGSGISGGDVLVLAVSGGNLYAGGQFTTAGGNAANNIAQWDGTNWSALGSGLGVMYSSVWALAASGGTLYVGGEFSMAETNEADNIAQWNGSSWSALGSGMNGLNGDVFALAVSGGTLYAGGQFTAAGDSAVNYVAQWNGSSWSALGSGMSGVGGYTPGVYALAVSGGTLYAGGSFTNAGGTAASGIAQWNGSGWSALGSGMPGSDSYGPYVQALAVSGGIVYAGGSFTNAGGSAANYIAQWNGSSWSPVSTISGGDPYGPYVRALVVSGGTLYAGGDFTLAGGHPANNIARWNGSSWSPLGSGLSGGLYTSPVEALAVSGGMLYAGGDFTNAGGKSANFIAQWNGSSWSPLGSGMAGAIYYPISVHALAVSGGTLYAGGYFTTAGSDTNVNYIAQWDGTSWSALGSGMNSTVYALAVSGGTLYAGGDFTTAGTNVSACAAIANLPVPGIVTTNADFGFTNGIFGFDISGPSGDSVVIQASTDLQTWIPLQTNLLGSGPLHFSDPQSAANAWRFYRVQLLQ